VLLTIVTFIPAGITIFLSWRSAGNILY